MASSIHLKKNECYWVGDLSLVEYDGEPLAEWDAEGGEGVYDVRFKMCPSMPEYKQREKLPERISCASGKLGVLNVQDILDDDGVDDGCLWTLKTHDGRVGMVDGELLLMEGSHDVFAINTWGVDDDSEDGSWDDESESEDGYATDSSGEEYEPDSEEDDDDDDSDCSEEDSEMECEGDSGDRGSNDPLRAARALLELCDGDYQMAKEMLQHAATDR
jgi:hypothetical protein